MLADTTKISEGGTNVNRKCIVSGESLRAVDGIRFIVGPDGAIVPDLLGKLPGRGLWVRSDREAIGTAAAKGRFARAARQSVAVSDGLADQVERLLAKRCVDLIGLARRAGQAVAGFEKAQAWLRNGSAAVLVEASDGAIGMRRKMESLADGISVVDVLRADELGAAFGRERTVHVVLARGGLASKLGIEARRLEGFRSAGGEWGDE